MSLEKWTYAGEGDFSLKDYPTSAKMDKAEKKAYVKLTAENTQRIAELQDKLFAYGREGLLVMIQAMDAGGKDGAYKHVMTGVNPLGITVHSFKTPTPQELSHDYLWRAAVNLPPRGYIGLFNRSYYEDLLVVRVKEMWKGYKWAERCFDMPEDEFFDMRFRQINDFEQYLYENGYRVVKIFLNISKEEQAERFIARIDEEEKNWKFNPGDVDEREYWDQYMDAYEKAIDGTGTKTAPWYVFPADQKWYARWLVSEAIVKALEDIDPQYPTVSDEVKAQFAECRAGLAAEIGE